MGFLSPTIKTSVSVGQTSEFAATNSQYGSDIPIGFGTDRYEGNLMWWSEIRLIKSSDTQTQGGKGGPKQQTTTTTYEYFVDLDVAFVQVPEFGDEAEAVLRIWADGKVIYDATSAPVQQADNLTFRFYNGSETQLPDPLIEAAEGTDNVSAHRGLVHIVFENLDLSDFGNRIPAISAEIAMGGTASTIISTFIQEDMTFATGSNNGGITGHMALGGDGFFYYTIDNGTGIPDFIGRASLLAGPRVDNVAIGIDNNTGDNGNPGNLRAVNAFGDIFAGVGTGGTGSIAQNFAINNVRYDLNTSVMPKAFAFLSGSQSVAMMHGRQTILGDGVSQILVTDTNTWTSNAEVDPGPPDGQPSIDSLGSSWADDTFGANRGFVVPYRASQAIHFIVDDSGDIRIYKGTMAGISFVDSISPSALVADETGFDRHTLFIAYDSANDRVIGGITGDVNGGIIFSWIEGFGFEWVNASVPFGPRSGTKFEDGAIFEAGRLWAYSETNGRVCLVDLTDGSLHPDFNGETPGLLQDDFVVDMVWDERTQTLWTESGANSGNVRNVYGHLFSSGTGEDINPQAVVATLCSESGLDTSEFNVSALPTTAEGIKSLRRDSRQSYSDIIQNLLDLLSYNVVEVDGALTFRQKGLASSITIPKDDLVVSNNREGEVFARSVLREKDLPRVFEVNYRDSDNNYQDNVQRDQRPGGPVTSVVSDNIDNFDYSGAGQADAFQAAAVRELYTAWAEINRLSYRVPQKYLSLTATDTVTLDITTTQFVGRVRSSNVGANFSTEVDKVVEIDGQYTQVGVGDGGDAFDREIPNTGDTTAILLNLPLLFDVDSAGQDVSIHYWVGGGEPIWPGCVLYKQEGTSVVNNIGTSTAEAAIGVTDGAIPDPTTVGRFENDDASFVIQVDTGEDQFESTTVENILAGANLLAAIKANGETELIQFRKAVLTGTSTVTVSGLLRGRRGTEPYATGHTDGETVVLLSTASTQLLSNARTDINAAMDYVAPTIGQLFESATGFTFTPTGEDLKPYSPAQVDIAVPGTPDGVDISWLRRTRIGGEMVDDMDVPLSEQSENYEVDILDGPGGTVLRTLMTSTESVNYSDADITTDFGSLPAILDVVVYQISDAVGRGKPAVVSLRTT